MSADATERAKSRLGKAVYRLKNEGWVVRVGKEGKSAKWALRLQEVAA